MRNIQSSFPRKTRSFQANHLVIAKVEVPNRVLTCNMRKKFATVPVCVYQAVYDPATPTEFTVEFTFLPEINSVQPGVVTKRSPYVKWVPN